MTTREQNITNLKKELYKDGILIGAHIRITTYNDIEYEGNVFTFDPIANFLIIEECTEENEENHMTRIFQLDGVKEIKVLKKAEDKDIANLPHISVEELLRLEQRHQQIAERALASIGNNVPSEAQAIFDALNKTMPCEWMGSSIKVMSEVLIEPPYHSENCSSTNVPMLSRVRKVLEGEKMKLRVNKP